MVISILQKLYIPTQWYKDALQEGYMALYYAHKTYDKRKGKFTTYAYWKIRSRVTTFVSKIQNPYGYGETFYRNKKCSTIPINEEHKEIEQKNNTNVDNLRAIKLFCDEINHKFTQKEVDVIIDYYINGVKYKDLKKKWGNIAREIKKLKLDTVFNNVRKKMY